MKATFLAAVVLSAVVAAARGQQSQHEADRAARLEVAELKHEVDRAVLKESLSLLKRAERANQLGQNHELPDAGRQSREAGLDSLRLYVEQETARFEKQSSELARLRNESPDVARTGRTKLVDPDVELLEMELEADRMQLRKMMTVIRESELQKIQGYTTVPAIGGGTQQERDAALEKYKQRFERLRAEFSQRSDQLRQLHLRAHEAGR